MSVRTVVAGWWGVWGGVVGSCKPLVCRTAAHAAALRPSHTALPTAALSLLFLPACTEDFIDKDPIIGETIENFYRNEADALAAVNGAYAALQFETSPGPHFRWFWGDIMSDDAVKGGSGDNDGFPLLLLETFEGPTTNDRRPRRRRPRASGDEPRARGR